MRPSALLIAALTLSLTACIGPGTKATPSAARPAPETTLFAPLAPATLGHAVDAEQLLSAAYGARESSLRCIVTVDADTLQVVGLTASGQRVFSLRYDGHQIDGERSAFAPEQIDPRHILTDIQLAFWPLDAVAAAAEKRGWQVSEPRPGLRRVSGNGRIVAEVHYADADPWNGRLWLSNFVAGYSLDIRTRSGIDTRPPAQPQ
jgi:hypothetical protein